MKKSIFALVGAALMLASGFVFTGCSSSDDEEEGSATMTVNFKFSDFTVDSFSVTAYNGINADDGSETVAAKVSADGKSATCTVTNAHANASGWLTLNVLAKKDGAELAITFVEGAKDQTGAWFEFVEDGSVNITYALVKKTESTAISSDALTIGAEGTYQLAVAYDKIKNYSAVYITLANITDWGNGTYDLPCLGTDASTWKANTAWVTAGTFTDKNVGGTTGGYFAEISPADYPDGVFITGKTGLSGTLYVSGK